MFKCLVQVWLCDISCKLTHASWLGQVGSCKLFRASWLVQVGCASWLVQVGSCKFTRVSWLVQVGSCKLARVSWLRQVGSRKFSWLIRLAIVPEEPFAMLSGKRLGALLLYLFAPRVKCHHERKTRKHIQLQAGRARSFCARDIST